MVPHLKLDREVMEDQEEAVLPIPRIKLVELQLRELPVEVLVTVTVAVLLREQTKALVEEAVVPQVVQTPVQPEELAAMA